jgi:beta-lactamase class A
MIDRRTFMLSASAALGGCAGRAATSATAEDRLRQIQAGLGWGARLGIAALDTASGRRIEFDAGSRYAMCSTFKAPLAAFVLAEAERGALSSADEHPISRSDLLPYAPVVTARLELGRITVEQLCAAIVEVSDNSAANILLKKVGGPAGFTAFVRRCGDPATRLDRIEPELNSNIRGDPRDTTTPAAMLGLMQTLLLGNVLTPPSRARLAGWMESSTTGRERLRAGFPTDWRVGDKTGTANGANNDLAIAWPPGRHPILVASYIDARGATEPSRNTAHAAVARVVTSTFG